MILKKENCHITCKNKTNTKQKTKKIFKLLVCKGNSGGYKESKMY